MPASRSTFKLVTLGVFVAVVGWAVYNSIEFYEETEESGWSIEALRNPYLAAQKFMTESGIEVNDVESLARLHELSTLGTLFFSDANQIQTPRQLQQVLDWLEVGGNVIYTANTVAHSEDLLLKEFAVGVEWREFEEQEPAEEKSLSETLREYNRQIEDGKTREEIVQIFKDDEELITWVKFSDDIGHLEIAFNDDKVLTQPYLSDSESDPKYQPFSWSSSEHGVHMMQFDVGSGLLTIISDPGIWTSYQIDRYDHAYLLWLLSSDEGNFAILRSVLRDSIWVLIGRNATELVVATVLLMLLWIWHTGIRFGRLLPTGEGRSRALGEYFSSISHYLWHRRHGEYLVAAVRQRVLRRAKLTLSDFARSNEQQQAEMIAEHCDLNPVSVTRALGGTEFNETSLVQTVRLLKHIEQSL